MKRKYIIFIVLLTLTALTIGAMLSLRRKQQSPTGNSSAQKKAEQSLVTETTNQIGGEIIKDGFNISYESGEKRFIITITAEPFNENKQKAIDYLNSIGVKVCEENYVFLAARGVRRDNNQSTTSCGI